MYVRTCFEPNKGRCTWVPSPNSQVTWGQSMQSQPLITRKLGLTISHGVPSPSSQVTWGQSVQSQPLIAQKLGFTTSHGVPSPNSQVTWGQSVQSQPLIARKLGLTTSHRVPSPNSQVTWGRSMQSPPLIAWKLGLTTSHRVSSPKSQVWHGCLHDNTFWRWGLRLVLRFGLSKKARPNSPNKSWEYFCIKKNPTLMMTNHILTVSWGSKIGT